MIVVESHACNTVTEVVGVTSPNGALDDIAGLAAQVGFERSGIAPASAIEVSPEVRDMCNADRCRSFGKNWMCPPHCGELGRFQQMIEAKTACYVVQTVATLEDEFDFDGMVEAEHVHKRRFASFSQKIRTDLNMPDALPLSAGTCTLCPSCSCPDAPCRYPERAFYSMEAAGLLVSDVCSAARIPYYHGKGTIAYVSCVLV